MCVSKAARRFHCRERSDAVATRRTALGPTLGIISN